MINYITQVVLFQVLFLAIYDLFLSKETFFTKNRWYLLCTPILSFLLPLVKIPSFQKVVPQEFIVYLPEIIMSPQKVIQEMAWYQSVNYLHILFGIGVVIFSLLFTVKILQIAKLKRSYKRVKKDGYTLVLIPKQTKAFSFFSYIFLGEEIPAAQMEQIIAHELVHSKQKHSFDLLFFEFFKIVMWFNPMIFIYQKRITLVHEYISDAVATKASPQENYINQLLSNFFQVENIAFINQFYKQSLIKKRIIMIKKKQSNKMNQWKYLVLIPVLLSMLFYTSCSEHSSTEIKANKELQTRYFELNDKLKVSTTGKLTYFDIYVGTETPEGKEISYTELSIPEREEYDLFFEKQKNKEDTKFKKRITLKIFEKSNARKTIASLVELQEAKNPAIQNSDDLVNFRTIEKAPTFPGCSSGDKDCFSKMVQKHFSENFDSKLPNGLGLSAGKKRLFIGFKVDVKGGVVGIKVRAPNSEIKEEVLRVMRSLPKMIPGEQDGVKIGVSYTIPFILIVD
jgi:bla regulator protein BlaR1